MLEKVRRTIVKHGMLERGATICVAVSGGVDSCALLHVLNAIREEFSLRLIVCHLNHNLRGKESDRDFRFVKKLAVGLGLRFVGAKLTLEEVRKRKGKSLQEWARERRMGFLRRSSQKFGAAAIALGHNMDDQAETVLMRFIKGSGTSGLCGMRPKGAGLIRPLAETSREEIERYARQNGLKHVLDSTNKSPKYLRNRVRSELIPFIEGRYNPNIKETVLRTARALRSDDDYLRSVAEGVFPMVARRADGKSVLMDRGKLLRLPGAILARVFLMALEVLKERGNGVYTPQIDGFIALLKGEKPNAAVTLRKGLYVKREYDAITVSTDEVGWRADEAGCLAVKTALSPKSCRGVRLKIPGRTEVMGLGCGFKAAVLNKRPRSLKAGGPSRTAGWAVAYFDYEKVALPIEVRTFKPGDRMTPLGMKGHKKLKDIFMDDKIPEGQRRAIPLVVSGGDIIWAVGHRQAEACKVGDGTKKVLRLEVFRSD